MHLLFNKPDTYFIDMRGWNVVYHFYAFEKIFELCSFQAMKYLHTDLNVSSPLYDELFQLSGVDIFQVMKLFLPVQFCVVRNRYSWRASMATEVRNLKYYLQNLPKLKNLTVFCAIISKPCKLRLLTSYCITGGWLGSSIWQILFGKRASWYNLEPLSCRCRSKVSRCSIILMG